MKKLNIAIMLFLFGITAVIMAANTANQTVTFEVQAINEISVSGNPGTLTVSVATAGSQPNDATDNSTTYNITTNGTNKKLTGSINTAMPANTDLKVNLTAPTGATSAGTVTLSTVAQNLVTGVTQKAEGSLTISLPDSFHRFYKCSR